MAADILIMNGGTIFQFWPQSKAAKAWWAENVQDGMWLGRAAIVEHRYAPAIIEGLAEAGFEIEGI